MTITVQNASEIKNAQGVHRNKNAKPVVCLDTGEVYSSATDAAEANGVSIYSVSMNCLGKTKRSNGKRFCYIKDVAEHLDELTTNMQTMSEEMQTMSEKAKRYDELIARKDNEKHKAETPTSTYVAQSKPKANHKSFGHKIIDIFTKRNIRAAI